LLCVCSCFIFGIVGQTVGYQFYQTPNLAATLAGCFFAGLATQPEHRLRVISRILLICFVTPMINQINTDCTVYSCDVGRNLFSLAVCGSEINL